MSDNQPEPVVEECDMKIAAEYESLDFADAYHLAGMFAAHRTAAVARREAEIVQLLEQLHESYSNAGYYKGTCILVSIKSLIDKIQNGGGA